MKRAPIVIAGTVAGLVAVLEFHTTPAKLSLAGGSSLGAGSSLAGGSSTAPGSAGGSGAATQPASGGTNAAGSAQPGAASGQAGTRTATGPQVNYNFGVLSVRVTVSGGKIRKVGIAYLDDGGNPRSQFIDQQAIPILERETLAAQSANIQGVSGASFTSAGFDQSLQSALHSLGM